MIRSPVAGVDLALAVALAAVGVTIAKLIDKGMKPETPLDVWGMLLIATAALALSVRRRWTLSALAVTTGATTLYLLLGYSYGPIMVSLFIAVYSLARFCPPRRSAPVAAVALGVLLTHLITNAQALSGARGVVPGSAWVVVPFAIGLSVRQTRQAREQERARQLADERMRLAQDVHDIVGHNLAAIKVQADVALHVLEQQPNQAEVALRAISGTSGAALNELRIALAELTSDSTLAPTPGLARLDELAERMRDAGLRVHIERSGTPHALPEPVDVAGYRVVQEALTNVLRHGPVPHAEVAVQYRDEGVTLQIANPLPRDFPAPRAGSGMGLTGMQRRVTALGGRFGTAITPDSRFQVTAFMPEPAP
ncbi:MAG TPA: histidine kinase [Jatrophihabitans sp.]|jgi:signal transduction histidine kinase|nr:histidine kinase [Jatrophihabitans sp.]